MNNQIAGFDWDEGNITKCQKHGVSIEEIEALFENDDNYYSPDILHSKDEQRFNLVGRSRNDRMIFLVFTVRKREISNLIRVISARFMHKKETDEYEKDHPSI